MKKHIKPICIILVVIIAAGFGINKYTHRMRYNDTFVNGNSSGNLYNAGLFCEKDGSIYFSNPDDEGKLYSMDSSGSNLKKLCNDVAMYINADSHYVYYVRNNTKNTSDFSFFSYNNNSLCRIPKDGGDTVILDEDPCIYASLIGNYIYYLHYDTQTATTLYKIKIDGKEKKQLSDTYIFTCNTYDKYFYYSNNSNGALYRYNTDTDYSEFLYDCTCYDPIVLENSNAYYLDPKRNNALIHVNLNSPNPLVLSDDFIELYNVYGSYVYFQRGGDDPALCMIKNDGTGYRELAKGEYCNINVTSYNIYFTDFFTKETYYTSTVNPGKCFTFHPGK